MLWTDAVFLTQEDLKILDSELPTIASEEGITLDGPNGFIRNQIDEAGDELMSRVEVFGGLLGSSTISSNHLNAVFNVGGSVSFRAAITLYQIVITYSLADRWSHVKRWVAYKVIENFYRNAYSRSASKDRYKSKLNEFQRHTKQTQNFVFDTLGLPVVFKPLSRPAAMREVNSGEWTSDNVSLVNGSGTATGMYDVAITYVDQSDYVSAAANGNAESAASEYASVELLTSKVLHVDISTLNPPTGVVDQSVNFFAPYSTRRATGWNVYVGVSGKPLYLQNASPISIATTTYELSGNPVLSGYPLGTGQFPDVRYQFHKTLQRA